MALASSRLVLEFARLRSAPTSFSILPFSSQSNWRISRRFCSSLIGGIQFASQVPEMLAGMIEIDDLNRTWKVLIGNIPDPVRAITHDNSDAGPVPASIVGLGINTEPKLFRGLDRANIGGGILVTDRPALIIDISLRKHAAQFAFPGASRLTVCSTSATFGLGLHHK